MHDFDLRNVFQEGNPELKEDLPVYVEFMQFHTKLEL